MEQHSLSLKREKELARILDNTNLKTKHFAKEKNRQKPSSRKLSNETHYVTPKYLKTEGQTPANEKQRKNTSYDDRWRKSINKTSETSVSDIGLNNMKANKPRKSALEIYNNKETKMILSYYKKRKEKGVSAERKY